MSNSNHVYSPIRRIVAGHDESGKSVVISDGDATNFRQHGERRSTLMWATKELLVFENAFHGSDGMDCLHGMNGTDVAADWILDRVIGKPVIDGE